MQPVYEEVFVNAIKKIEKDFFFDGERLLEGETLLSSWLWYDAQEKAEQITVVTKTRDNNLRVHTLVVYKGQDLPFYGSNLFHDPITMISKMNKDLDPGERWCGDAEHDLFKQFAESTEA